MEGYSRVPERGDTDVIGVRILAQIADSIAMGVVFIGPPMLLSGASDSLGAIGVLIGLGLALGYGFLLEGIWDGKTIGKAIVGIKVVEEDGSPCSVGSAFMRNLLEIIDGLFYYLVGFIAIAASDRRQRIGDRIAGTVVVREEKEA